MLDVDALVSEAVQAHENGETMIVQVKISCLNQFLHGDFHEFQSCKSTCLFRFVRSTLFKTDLIIEGQKDKI